MPISWQSIKDDLEGTDTEHGDAWHQWPGRLRLTLIHDLIGVAHINSLSEIVLGSPMGYLSDEQLEANIHRVTGVILGRPNREAPQPPVHVRPRAEKETILTGPMAEFIDSLLGAAGERSNPTRISTVQQAASRYVQMVKMMPEVQEVRITEGDKGTTLLTIIIAEPFDEGPRERIINAQLEVMENMVVPVVDFDLINLSEFEPGKAESFLGNNFLTVWKR